MAPKKEIVLIGDSRIKSVTVKENGEPLVDLLKEFPALKFDLERDHVQKQSRFISLARRRVGEMLVEAQGSLPKGYKLLIKECHRPMWVQKGFWEGYSEYLRKKFPDWSESEVYNECSKLNAPLEVAPHTTGGAVDLTLTTDAGDLVDMGTPFNASPLETDMATYTDATSITDEAKKNRQILVTALVKVGFVNYPTEWWHWSYGDKYWAFMKNEPAAIYESREVEEVRLSECELHPSGK